MPTSITRLSKFTIPIAGLNPRGAGLPTHNMISPAAGVKEGKAKNDRGKSTYRKGGERKKEIEGTSGVEMKRSSPRGDGRKVKKIEIRGKRWGWKVLEEETLQGDIEDWIDRKRGGKAKSNKMKLGSPVLVQFRNVLSSKGIEINTKKHLTSDFMLEVRPHQRILPHENTLKEKTNYCERA